jgi:hypothetical protein
LLSVGQQKSQIVLIEHGRRRTIKLDYTIQLSQASGLTVVAEIPDEVGFGSEPI